jgi:hypothetical protein
MNFLRFTDEGRLLYAYEFRTDDCAAVALLILSLEIAALIVLKLSQNLRSLRGDVFAPKNFVEPLF